MRLVDRLRSRATVSPQLPEGQSIASWFPAANETMPATFGSFAASGYLGNGIVYACILARLNIFAQAEFKFQSLADKRLFGNSDLRLLERPWPGGTTADLLARMEQDVSLAGNAFVFKARDDRLVRLRPDWVEVVTVSFIDETGFEFRQVDGVIYREGGFDNDVFLPIERVAHWTPIPDPLASWRGMSWLTPVVREINGDISMTDYKRSFYENNATPNLMIRYQQKLSKATIDTLRERWAARYAGPGRSGGTVVIDDGGDVQVVGNSMQQNAFEAVQAAGENRIAAAAGVPAIVVGLKEGLAAATYSNYEQALKAFANSTLAYNWQSAVTALSHLVAVPAGARLWYDTSAVLALRDAETARAETAHTQAQAASVLITAGYDPDSVQSALAAGDVTLLQHSGLVSVQLQQPGQVPSTSRGGTL